MKKLFFVFAVMLFLEAAHSQLKTTPVCPTFTVDILDGKIGEVTPSSTQGVIKSKFPCFTKAEDETAASQCGGVIFYNDKGLYFYTGRDYIEIKENFKGKLSIPLMGANRNNLFKWLGLPKIKDINWDAFQMAYGILILYYNKAGNINKLQISNKGTETIKLCE
jgi:hypothetical protein